MSVAVIAGQHAWLKLYSLAVAVLHRRADIYDCVSLAVTCATASCC